MKTFEIKRMKRFDRDEKLVQKENYENASRNAKNRLKRKKFIFTTR